MYVCRVINKVKKTVFTGGSAGDIGSVTGLSFELYQEIAYQVLRGEWGSGTYRRNKLEEAGYVYDAVQTIVNHEYYPNTPIDMSYFSNSSSSSQGTGSTSTTQAEVEEERIFHFPAANDKSCILLSGRTTTELNKTGTFEFQLPPSNQCLKDKCFNKLTSIVEVIWWGSDEILFRGRIMDSAKAFANTVTFKCEGWMSVLNDSVVKPQPAQGGDNEEDDFITRPIGDFFESLIQQHNDMVGISTPKALVPIVVGSFADKEVNFQKPNYEKTLDYLQTNFINNEDVGGRMYVDSYIDEQGARQNDIYLVADDEDLQETSQQAITFGRNLSDLTETINAAELYTVIIPTGKDGLKLSGNGYIESNAGVSKYGKIWHHEDFSDIESESELRTKALEVLNRNIGEVPCLEVSAIDLNLINFEIPMIKVGEYVPVFSKPHGIDVAYICSAITLDICNPANSKYTLGINEDTLTTKQLKLSKKVAETVLNYESKPMTIEIPASIYDNRIEFQEISFYKTATTVYLSFVATILKPIPDNDPKMFTYNTYYNPLIETTAVAYDQTTSKNYTVKSGSGEVRIFNNNEIAVNDVISCSMTWMTRK